LYYVPFSPFWGDAGPDEGYGFVVEYVSIAPPTILISSNGSTLSAGQTTLITFSLSTGSTDFVLGDVDVAGGSLSNFTGSGANYSATFTPNLNSTASGVVSVASNRFSDSFGNINIDGSDPDNAVNFTIDTVVPTIAVTSNDTSLAAGQVATVFFVISESTTDFGQSDITVSGGLLSAFAGTGANYSAIFTPNSNSTANGVVSVGSGKFSDAVGSFNVDGSDANNTATFSINTVPTPVPVVVVPDTTPPTISITTDETSLSWGETALLTFKFNEEVIDFVATDISVTGGTLGDLMGGGSDYTAVFTPTTNITTNAVIHVADKKFSDSAGNPNVDGNDKDNTLNISVDTVLRAPTITITSDESSLNAGQATQLTFKLSTKSIDFSQSDVSIFRGILSDFSGSGSNYSATFHPLPNSSASAVVSIGNSRFSNAVGIFNQDGSDVDNSVTLAVNTQTTSSTPGLRLISLNE
jgi:hypothetical protein